MAVLWALACMLFAASNDLLFKFYARKDRGLGFFVSIIGVIWLIISLILAGAPPADWRATIIWGVISGFFSVAGNLMMLDAMRSLDVGVCSTIYRLNLVPVVIGAALILDEQINLTQYCGIICACAAICAFIPRGGSQVRKSMNWALLVMITAAFMRSGMGLSYRYGFLHGADEKYVVVVNSLFWIFGGVVYAFWRERDRQNSDSSELKKLFGYGIFSGLLASGIVLTMAQALKAGSASVVLPIAQMSFLVTGALGICFLHEKLSWGKAAAFICGTAAIILLSC